MENWMEIDEVIPYKVCVVARQGWTTRKIRIVPSSYEINDNDVLH